MIVNYELLDCDQILLIYFNIVRLQVFFKICYPVGRCQTIKESFNIVNNKNEPDEHNSRLLGRFHRL